MTDEATIGIDESDSKAGRRLFGLGVVAIVCFLGFSEPVCGQEHMLVANRGSGSISRIDIATNTVTNFTLPGGGEPMYIVHSPDNQRVYVGDRANNRLVIYNAGNYASSIGSVSVGAGIFHMWGDRNHNQLWVNNDIDKTVSVVNMLDGSVIDTITTPADLSSGKPHDVFINPNANSAYVTMLGVTDVMGANDYVLRYDTTTRLETGRIAIGNDPHVSYSPSRDHIFAPTQGGDAVSVIMGISFGLVDTIAVPNSHGAWMSRDEDFFYTTNISDGGTGGLVTIDADTRMVLSSFDVPDTVPHNVITTPDDTRLYLTHSGANNQVSIFNVADPANPVFLQSVTTESNPYGIAYIPATIPEPASGCLFLIGGFAMIARRRR